MNFITLNILFFVTVFIISILVMYISNLGLLGLRAKKFCKTVESSIIEKIIVLFLLFSILMFLINLYNSLDLFMLRVI